MTAPTSRSSLVGAALGLVLLGLLVAFAVALPESAHSTKSEAAPDPDAAISLPDTLPGGWTAVDVAGPKGADAAQTKEFTDNQTKALRYVTDVLEKVYAVPTTFRVYATSDLSEYITLTAWGAPGGAFGPNGLNDPELSGLARAPVELVRIRDTVCTVNWQPVPVGQAIDPAAKPTGVECQLSEDGRTFQIGTGPMAPEESVKLLEAAAGAAT
ncbi:hypothetical protein [Nocardioides sp.]|uniref:hypothetical protein n=1 Tax=Nocardioides sp. TaxID=35761 RepID=UPI0031FF0399